MFETHQLTKTKNNSSMLNIVKQFERIQIKNVLPYAVCVAAAATLSTAVAAVEKKYKDKLVCLLTTKTN